MVHETVDIGAERKQPSSRFFVRRKSDDVWLVRTIYLEHALHLAHFLAGTAGVLVITRSRSSKERGRVICEITA